MKCATLALCAAGERLALPDPTMTVPKAKITALGCFVPPNVLTNKDLEKMVDTNDEWIVTRTGIRERHIAPPEMATSDMAIEAAKCALLHRGIPATDVE